jgi:hypothetical protein
MAPSGAEKAAYTPFGALARLIDGETVNVKAGIVPAVKVFFPTLFFYQGTGGTAGMTWRVFDHVTGVAVGQPVVPFAADGSLTIPLVGFTPVKGHTYTLTVEANEATGHMEDETATLVGT